MTTDLRTRAAELDASDPLRHTRDLYLPSAGLVAYLDGNSLGRPLRATAERITRLVEHDWADRLIRSWDEQWMQLPLRLGDRIGEVCLGAAPGQTVVGDSTTVMLYKLLRAAVAAAGPQRPEIVLDTENFPTDRYVAEGIAAETGAELVWLEPDPAKGVTPDLVASALTDRTGVVLLSHVAYKSAWIADLPEITRLAHEAGALVLWDMCHSVGVVASDLDAHGVDLAVGCTYKFLGGGPGAPAFGYVAARHQDRLRQPIQGWMGHAAPFVMGPGYEAGAGMRGFISGTPPVLGMVGIEDTVDLIESVGLGAVRDKAAGLGRFVIAAVDERLARLGVRLVSPREDATRGGHVTIAHEDFREVYRALWDDDVVPDFREPDGIRLGLSPLNTSYGEVAEALLRIEAALTR
ncbi:Kynureninase [Janibacter hoylei PVAS-1]|uniref:Kynureninase n=1 Tax=Janibacter hoylei PVAS-1 TaxID=1210046 RepID=K1E9J6_9MICO|nr:aminotransferase class V-fold PLP-dependent enzyme [Janibacter hoylei]EKA62122.1 Kynureninase [Janibacter hoylei PVAS-1]RWU85153.1 aminotransferase class V-fold PLP-dependent enzyme [Janibacter hoylei PVAS-1]